MWYIEIDGTTGAYLQDYSEVFIRAENINSYGATSGQVLMADGSNGASWQSPSTPSVEGTSVLSTGATSGQVLQADGNGGASWQNAGGGGSSVYVHYITFYRTTASSTYRRLYCTMTIINNDSTAITSANSLRSAIISIGSNVNIATGGRLETGGNTNIYMPVSFLINLSGTLYLAGVKSDGTAENYDVYSAITNVTDVVVTL